MTLTQKVDLHLLSPSGGALCWGVDISVETPRWWESGDSSRSRIFFYKRSSSSTHDVHPQGSLSREVWYTRGQKRRHLSVEQRYKMKFTRSYQHQRRRKNGEAKGTCRPRGKTNKEVVSAVSSFMIAVMVGVANPSNAFAPLPLPLPLKPPIIKQPSSSPPSSIIHASRRRNHRRIVWRHNFMYASSSTTSLSATTTVINTVTAEMADYAPAAASLFNNMKLPAAVVTAGMISLGFATRFPELPRDTLDKVYPNSIRAQVAKLERLHIVLGLLSVTSELIVVLWAAVAVNQLTERTYEPATSVWDLIHRDCDLAWSAVNSHYILGIIGFVGMLWLRAYVMLLASSASKSLMNAASTGTAAATCLMISIVNRGVESGGGTAVDRYGNTILGEL